MSSSTTLVDRWSIKKRQYPEAARPADRLAFVLEYASLAPTPHGGTCWRIERDGDRACLDVRADVGTSRPDVDPEGRELTMCGGAAIFALTLALRRFGMIPRVAIQPDRGQLDLLARITLAEGRAEPTCGERELFRALRRRSRHPVPSPVLPPTEEDLRLLECHARHEAAALHLLDEPARAFALDLREGQPRRGRLWQWLHGDGGPPVPSIVVLTTPLDCTASWIHAGRALARVMLAATAARIGADVLDGFPSGEAERRELEERLGLGGVPQSWLAVGRTASA